MLLILLALFFLLPTSSFADTHAALSCSHDNVQAAIDNASGGDTVTVPAGECTWDNNVTVNKPIYLIGAGPGAGGTKINHGNHNGTLVSVQITDNAVALPDISGFWFNGGVTDFNSGCYVSAGSGSSAQYKHKYLRIHNNYMSGCDKKYVVIANIYVLIDNNTMTGPGQGPNFYGPDMGMGTTLEWDILAEYGTSNTSFVENNTFDGVYASDDLFNGARAVFRYNNISDVPQLLPILQTHDWSRGHKPASPWEVYNNKITSTSPQNNDVYDFAGGTGVIHHNEYIGTFQRINAMGEKTSCVTWRCPYQVGSSMLGDNAVTLGVYIYGNYGNSEANTRVGVSAEPVVEDRDYFLQKDNFDGTSGVGVGLLSGRPSTCTAGLSPPNVNGVAYYATDTGKLYRCSATNTWIEFYEPYTCPHPLTGLSGSCSTSVAGLTGYNIMAINPPTRFNAYPSVTLKQGTTSVTMSLNTDISSTCKYGTTDNTYANLPNFFSTTGETTHSQLLTGLSAGGYRYHVKCDAGGNPNTDDFIIKFGVAIKSGSIPVNVP